MNGFVNLIITKTGQLQVYFFIRNSVTGAAANAGMILLHVE
jgi:hypothetical protein